MMLVSTLKAEQKCECRWELEQKNYCVSCITVCILHLLLLSCYIKASEMGQTAECLAHVRGTRND
jgi:hypothetical protein